jgi:hypothetical protein
VVKAAVVLATDKRTWKALAVIIAAILTPLILIILMFAVLFGYMDDTISGSGSGSGSDSDIVIVDGQDEFAAFMQDKIAEIKASFDEKYTADTADENSPDIEYVKAVFVYIAPNLSESQCRDFDVNAFLDCFDGENVLEKISELYPEIKIDDEELNQLYNYVKEKKTV